MRLAYVAALVFSMTTPALAQTIVVNLQPGAVPMERYGAMNLAPAKQCAANAEAAAGTVGAATEDATKAAGDRAAAHAP